MVRDMVDDRLLRSVQLWAQVAEQPEYAGARTVMAFVGTNGEPDTDGLFARIERDGKRLVLPRLVDDRIVPCGWGDGLRPGAYSVPEPTGDACPVGEIDVVIVPGLAFTAGGARLGQGGGHYDRFLTTVTCPTIGVCFTEQLVDALPGEAHDVGVHTVVSA